MDLIWLEEGLEVEFQVETFPGEIFKGTISYIEPFVIEKTRTVRVRLQVPNPDFRLKPGMFAEAVQKKTIKDYKGKYALWLKVKREYLLKKFKKANVLL